MERQVNRKKETAITIHPNGIDDMRNLVRVAGAEGRNKLGVDVRIIPDDRLKIDGYYVIMVEPLESRCKKTQEQGKDVV